jgi:hypothetical protein
MNLRFMRVLMIQVLKVESAVWASLLFKQDIAFR